MILSITVNVISAPNYIRNKALIIFLNINYNSYFIIDAMIERISLTFTKRILRITPQVARRTGWNKHSHNEAFYIKFRSEEGRDEVSIVHKLITQHIQGVVDI